MRAVSYRRYGSPAVLELTDERMPVPGPHEVLVQVRATAVTAVDVAARAGRPRFARLFFGLRGPRTPVLGSDYAGTVVALGDAVTGFVIGDEVWGASGPRLGAHAEFVLAAEDAALAYLPTGVDHRGAAAIIDGALTALPFLRDGARLRAGQRILVIGAAGGIGSMAVQLAVAMGARVSAVCGAGNADLVRRLGATEVFDYASTDYSRSGQTWDVVFDTVNASSSAVSRRVLAPAGVYLATSPSVGLLLGLLTRRARILFTGLRPIAEVRADLAVLAGYIESGAVVPVIDREHPLDEASLAHAYVQAGHKSGTVLLIP